MSYSKVVAAEVERGGGSHPAASRYDRDIGAALEIDAFGIYQVELPRGATTTRHDHARDRAEDVYAAVRGSGVVVVDDEEVPLEAGQFIAVRPDSARYVRAGEDGLTLIAVCAAVS
jgi:mannose-6-phosphate isomerase-like protein (cupin superfamily)